MTQEAQLDDVYQAIAHHTRREILNLLRAGPKPVAEVASRFSISQPAVSQQLRVLLDAGLVTAEINGRQRIYHLNAQRLRPVQQWLGRTISGRGEPLTLARG